MPGDQEVVWSLPEGRKLVGEYLKREPGVQLGFVDAHPPQPAVLVVLHQPLGGVSGKSERAESQCVHHRQL